MHFENRNERVQSKAKQSKAVDLWWSQCWYPILFLFQPVTTVLLFILPSRAKLRRSCRQLRQLVEHLSFGLAVRLLWELVCVCVSVCVSVCLCVCLPVCSFARHCFSVGFPTHIFLVFRNPQMFGYCPRNLRDTYISVKFRRIPPGQSPIGSCVNRRVVQDPLTLLKASAFSPPCWIH